MLSTRIADKGKSVGLLTVNLLPLWDEAIKLLETFARANRGLFWDMCYKELLKFDDEKQLVLDGFASQVFGYLDAPPERNLDRPTRTGKIFFGDLTLAKYKVIKKVAMSAMQSKRATNSALFFSKVRKMKYAFRFMIEYLILRYSSWSVNPMLAWTFGTIIR